MRNDVMNTLHSAHQGLEGILRRARQSVYWPGLTNTIKQIGKSFKSCIDNAPSLPKEPLITTSPTAYPFQMVVADGGHQYLAYADRLTGWLDIIDTFRELFHRYGVPEEISLDGGPNITSKAVAEFMASWGTRIRLSSAPSQMV